jgi:amino acid permease
MPWGRRRNISDQTTEPSVVEGAHLQKFLKRQHTTTVSFAGVIEVGLFVGGWLQLELDQDRA